MRKIKVILDHILQDAMEIQDFIRGIDESEFVANSLIKKAVCMSLINIGELVKGLPNEFKNAHPEIPWKQIAGLRDLAAHKYQRLDFPSI